MSYNTVTLQELRFHPFYLTIEIPVWERLGIKAVHGAAAGSPLYPIAPPSPWYAGQNTDINLEPFPAFIDVCPPVKAEALHCVVHCLKDICRHLNHYKDVPPCRCGDEIRQKEPMVTTPAIPRPELTFENMFQLALLDNVSPDAEINIHRDDARKLISNFSKLARRRAINNNDFMTLARERWADPEDAAEHVIFCLFKLVRKYFDRTMLDTEVRTIHADTLRAELKLYLSTGLDDWLNDFGTEWDRALLRDLSGGDPRFVLEAARLDPGIVGVIAKLWEDCLTDIVLLFVVRDARVREFVVEQPPPPPLWAVVLAGTWISVTDFFTSCVSKVLEKIPGCRPIKI